MQIKIEKFFSKKEYNDLEKNMIHDIFGILPKNVYFYTKIEFDVKHKFNNVYGLSGDGKTVIKEELKEQLKNKDIKIFDFDDTKDFVFDNKDKTIIELFNIEHNEDKLLKMLSYFGFFEMRLLFEKIENLSNGQQTRLRYIYIINEAIKQQEECFIIIDEFLTFVDSLSSISFARGVIKFLKEYNHVSLFTFGVNDSLLGQFEDITYGLSNGHLSFIISRKMNNEYEIQYVDENCMNETLKFKQNINKYKISTKEDIKIDDLF